MYEKDKDGAGQEGMEGERNAPGKGLSGSGRPAPPRPVGEEELAALFEDAMQYW